MNAVVLEDPRVYTYVAGDYGVVLKFTVPDNEGTLIDLTGTTVTMYVQSQNAAADEPSVFSAVCSLSGYSIDPTQGQCYYLTQDGDAGFDTEGRYWIQLAVTDGPSGTYRYRNPRFAILHVTRKLLPAT